MGMYEEMKKYEELISQEGIHATFTQIEGGVNVKCTVNASQAEIEALIKSLVNAIAERNDIHYGNVLSDIFVQMMLNEEGGEE